MKKLILYIQCFILLVAFGCNEMEPAMQVSGDKVNVYIDLNIAQEISVNNSTKAKEDDVISDINVSDEIKNLWVIQFNGILLHICFS